MKKIRLLSGLIFSLVVIVTMVNSCQFGTSKDNYADLWGALGAGIFDDLKYPETAEYFKVSPKPPVQGNQTYEPVGAIQTLSDAQIATLQALLLNDNHYNFNITKKCLFIPEHAFRFNKGNSSVLVLVSLACKQITYQLNNQTVKVDIDPLADALNAFINKISTTKE